MKWKIKKLYDMTVPELLKKRRSEQVVGVLYSLFAFVFLGFGVLKYYDTGFVGPLVISCTFSVFMLFTSLMETIIIQQINMYVYLKEHEK